MWGCRSQRMMHGNSRRASQRGQSVLEYLIILAALCAVIVSMQVYTKRAVQGRWKASADAIGPQFSARWSGFTTSTGTQQYLRNVLSEEGESSSTLLDHAVVNRSPYVDRFSDKTLTEEKLFE